MKSCRRGWFMEERVLNNGEAQAHGLRPVGLHRSLHLSLQPAAQVIHELPRLRLELQGMVRLGILDDFLVRGCEPVYESPRAVVVNDTISPRQQQQHGRMDVSGTEAQIP